MLRRSRLAALDWAQFGAGGIRGAHCNLPDGVVVERYRPDFSQVLRRCRVSVSQAGYNTTLEVLAAGVAAVFVPFDEMLETEQALRAERLATRGVVTKWSPTRSCRRSTARRRNRAGGAAPAGDARGRHCGRAAHRTADQRRDQRLSQTSMRELYAYVWRSSAPRQIVRIISAIIAAVLATAPLELQRHIINTLAGHEKADRLAWLCGGYLIAALGIGGLKYLLNIKRGLGEVIILSLRQDMYSSSSPLRSDGTLDETQKTRRGHSLP